MAESAETNYMDATKEDDASDSVMDACQTTTTTSTTSTATNGESAHKIPKLMDIEASVPAPKLMRGIAPFAGAAAGGGPATTSTTAPAASVFDHNNSTSSAATAATTFDPSITLEHIRATQHKFVDDRDWHRYHTPRNLLLAMVGEVGELSELFQWRGEVGPLLPDWSVDDKRNLRHELADVFLYLVRLSEQCGVDLPHAVMEKIALNDKKYPAEMVRGSSKKYFESSQGTKLAAPREATADAKDEEEANGSEDVTDT